MFWVGPVPPSWKQNEVESVHWRFVSVLLAALDSLLHSSIPYISPYEFTLAVLDSLLYSPIAYISPYTFILLQTSVHLSLWVHLRRPRLTPLLHYSVHLFLWVHLSRPRLSPSLPYFVHFFIKGTEKKQIIFVYINVVVLFLPVNNINWQWHK